MSSETSGIRAFPPLIAAAGIVVGLALTFLYPVPIVDHNARQTLFGLGVVFLVIWFALAISANLTFRGHKTPVNPYAPTTALARSGPYKFTRNPMYLGLVLLTVGFALVMNSMWLILMAVPVMLALRNLVIVHEERYLEGKFGDEYREYTKRVRRWL